MKKLLLILLCLPMIGFGQVTSPSVISSSGDSYSNGGVNILSKDMMLQEH